MAAQVLNVRQSTLSRRLRFIEQRLDAQLFERTNGGTHPTIAGMEFLETARRILDETGAAFRKLKARSRGESGQLTIGVCASFTTGNMHATLAEHHRRFPEVDVHVVDGTPERLLSALAAGAVDATIMTRYRSSWDGRCLPLWSERLVVAIPKHHRLSQNAVVQWPDLAVDRILIPRQGPGAEFERLLAMKLQVGCDQRILYQEAGLDRLLSLVSTSHGVLLMLEGATGLRYEGVTYREIHEDGGPTRLSFDAYWQHSNCNPALRPFLNMLRERYPDLSDDPDPS